MTDEQKQVNECNCKNCEICKLVGKFFFLTGAIFLGTLMALLLAHALNKPKFPPPYAGFYGHRPGIEKQFQHKKHMKGHCHKFDKNSQRPQLEKRGEPRQRMEGRPPRFEDQRPPKQFEGKKPEKKLNRAYVNPEKINN